MPSSAAAELHLAWNHAWEMRQGISIGVLVPWLEFVRLGRCDRFGNLCTKNHTSTFLSIFIAVAAHKGEALIWQLVFGWVSSSGLAAFAMGARLVQCADRCKWQRLAVSESCILRKELWQSVLLFGSCTPVGLARAGFWHSFACRIGSSAFGRAWRKTGETISVGIVLGSFFLSNAQGAGADVQVWHAVTATSTKVWVASSLWQLERALAHGQPCHFQVKPSCKSLSQVRSETVSGSLRRNFPGRFLYISVPELLLPAVEASDHSRRDARSRVCREVARPGAQVA